MIVAFTGGRDYRNEAMVDAILDIFFCCEAGLATPYQHAMAMRVGDCPTGLDAMIREKVMPPHLEPPWVAHWDAFGQSAGPIRNREMLCGRSEFRTGRQADLLIAFPGGNGTADCVRQARALGIAVIEVPS